ncbi:MAG TPA: hypothetical protein VFF06_31760 [Polyangia bacterium]|nr:hypothetical protein [Polyangia bacterium]
MLHRGTAVAFLFPLVACSAAPSGEPSGAAASTIEAYYGGELFTASYREFEAQDDAAGESVSILYQSDPGIAGGGAFVSVLSAMSSGSNPVWHEVQLSGNQCPRGEVCAVPVQFTSAAEILAAVGDGPEQIRLVPTDTRCSVLGLRPASARRPIDPGVTQAPAFEAALPNR